MSGYARDFNNIETRAVIKFFSPARQGAEGNSRHSVRNIRGACTIVANVKNWVAQFKDREQRAKKCIELRGEYVE